MRCLKVFLDLLLCGTLASKCWLIGASWPIWWGDTDWSSWLPTVVVCKPGGHATPGCKMRVQTERRSCTHRDHCTIQFILTVLAGSSPKDNMGWWILKLSVFINKRQGCNNILWDWSVSSRWFKYLLGAGQRVPVLLWKKGKKRLIYLWLPNFSIWPV